MSGLELESPLFRGPIGNEICDVLICIQERYEVLDSWKTAPYLDAGKMTLVAGASEILRRDYIASLVCLTESTERGPGAPRVNWYSRRWISSDIARSLLASEFSRSGSSCPQRQRLIQAYQTLRYSEIYYDNTVGTIHELCRQVRIEAQACPIRLVVVDGLDYFREEEGSSRSPDSIRKAVKALNQLAADLDLPVLVSCRPVPSFWALAVEEVADYQIRLTAKE